VGRTGHEASEDFEKRKSRERGGLRRTAEKQAKEKVREGEESTKLGPDQILGTGGKEGERVERNQR